MSPGMRTALLWAVLIFVAAYALNINIASFLTGIVHSIQQAHVTNGGH